MFLAHRPAGHETRTGVEHPGCLCTKARECFPVHRATLSQYLELGEPQAAAFVQHTLRTLVRQLWSTELGPEHRGIQSRNELIALEDIMHNRNQCDVDEVAALQGTIESKDLLLQERQTAFDDLERRFNSALNDMRAKLNEKQTLVDQSQSEIQQVKAQMTEIIEQRTRLETLQKQTDRLLSAQAEQIRAGVRAEIEASESQLIDKESELQSCHGGAREAELCHAAELMELRLRIRGDAIAQ